jgi:putative tryptophan/tyrosine transport system substrate-binding protein
MNRTGWSLILVAAMLLTVTVVAQAQQEKKVARIGLLRFGSGDDDSLTIGPFREELRKLGWVEGTNILIDYRSAGGNRDRARDFADELVRTKVDLIVVTGSQAIAAAKAATSSIPIIALRGGDLLGSGIVTSLARPGGNITGSTRMASELAGKRMELLKESLSQLSRVGIIVATRQDEEELKEMEGPARQLSVKIQPANVRGLSEFQGVFASMMKERAEAVIIVQSGVTFTNRGKLLGLASKHRLPSMCEDFAWSDAGCLMSYGPDVPQLLRRGAYFVDQVLKGAKPGDLPVEQPTKFEFVINLKTAKQIGLTIPPNVLARADKVIK